MPTCPFATDHLIPPGGSDPRIAPRIAILHVDAGNADSLYDYFNGPSGGIESHFFVKRDGEIEQYRDTSWQADANLDANDFAVSIETQGYGEGEWTAEQLDSIKRLLVWLHEVHPAIPLRKCDRWDGSGIGYHVQFGAPGHWTPVSKSCPGPDRVRQFHNVIVPWLNAGADEEDPMAQFTEKQISDLMDAAVTRAVPAIVKALLDTKLGNDDTVRNNLRRAGDTKQIAQDVARLVKDGSGES